ncbi:MAG: LamG domain-containing protein, partial [Chloroflexi bacterium]|nr:LamG domain-containing protein [Chloroflexota bacterium]
MLRNGATFAPGMVGQAFSLDGVNDYVEISDEPNLRLSDGSFSIDAWIRPATSGGGQFDVIVDKSLDNSNLDYELLLHTDGRLRLVTRNLANDILSPSPIPNDVWTHVAGVQDVDQDEVRLYVNGAEVAVETLEGSPVTNTASVLFGIRHESGGTIVKHAFKGLIDEIEILDRALNGPELEAIFNAGSAGKCKVQVDTTAPRCEVIGLNVDGDLEVEVQDGGSGLATAQATAVYDAANDVTIRGDIKVTGIAANDGASASNAVAGAVFDLDAGLGGSGNVAMTGGINVVALADAGSGAANATASAAATIDAPGDVVIVADLTKTIAVVAVAQSAGSDANANGSLDFAAGDAFPDIEANFSLDIIGAMAVLVSAGAPQGTETATAALTLSAADGLRVQFIKAPPTSIAQSVGGDPLASVQLTQADINAELLVDLV